MSPVDRVRSPYLLPRVGVGTFAFQDTLDACTPRELSVASWSLMLQRMLQQPRWRFCRTKTFFLCPQDIDPNVLFKGNDRLPWLRVFGRKVVEGRVVRRAWGYLVGDLPEKTALTIPMLISLGPCIFTASEGFDALVVPATGPSSRINMLKAHDVVEAVGFEFELEAGAVEQGIIKTYGFNLIPHFRRLFELRHEPPIPGLF